MKKTLKDLKRMFEATDALNLTYDQILEILDLSVDYDYYVQELEDIKDEVQIENSSFRTGQPTLEIQPFGLTICTAEDFIESEVDCGREYLVGKIDDLLEDFFDRDAFYKACQEEKWLNDLVLEYNDVSKWEEVTYNGIDYIICE